MRDARYLAATDAEEPLDFYDPKIAKAELTRAFDVWNSTPDGGRLGRPKRFPGEHQPPGYRRMDEKRRGSGGAHSKSKKKSMRMRSNFNLGNCLKVLRFLRGGSHFPQAMLAAGLSRDDTKRWIARMADPKYATSPYVLFFRAVDQVVATVEAMHANNVHTAGFRKGADGLTTQQAIEHSKWWLQNRYSDRWHGKQGVDVTTGGDKLPDNKVEMVVVNAATATPVEKMPDPVGLIEGDVDEDSSS